MIKNSKVLFDMDGTIADLYNVNDWLNKLQDSDASVFAEAKPLVDINAFKAYLRDMKTLGHSVEISTWLPKNATNQYKKAVIKAKAEWLVKYGIMELLDAVNYLDYGVDKSQGVSDIIYDDSDEVLLNFKGVSKSNILLYDVLKAYCK